MNESKTLIIGAGPAGLAIAARLKQAELLFEILEQSDKIASSWHNHYDRLHLHTVKAQSSLPFINFPDHYPQYVSRHQLVEYYEAYAEHFQLKPHFNTKVISVRKLNNYWHVVCENGKTFEVQNVVVATGINRIPKLPYWKGQDHFEGEIIHASKYKNPEPYKNKKVLVVGMGNTGAEIALDLAEHQVEVDLCVRSEVVIVPRDFLGKSVQVRAQKLAKLPFNIVEHLADNPVK